MILIPCRINSHIVAAAWNATDDCDFGEPDQSRNNKKKIFTNFNSIVMVVADAVKTLDNDFQNIIIGIEKRQKQFQKELQEYKKTKALEQEEQQKLLSEIKENSKKSKQEVDNIIKAVEITIDEAELNEDEDYENIEGEEDVEPLPLDYILVLNKVSILIKNCKIFYNLIKKIG